MKRPYSQDAGQAMVEFALVLPVLALLLMGIVDLGRIVFVGMTVSEAARDAVRYASIGYTDDQLAQVVTSDTSASGNQVTWTVSPSGSRTSGSTVTVTVSSPVPMIDPLMAAIIGSAYQVQSSYTMLVE